MWWLIAIPSQIQPQLLLSFESFFLSNNPTSGLEKFKGITPIADEDICKEGASRERAKILFVTNRTLENISEPDRLGTVAHIRGFWFIGSYKETKRPVNTDAIQYIY